jgi:hypothetical protein
MSDEVEITQDASPPERYRTLKNGAIYDMDRHRIADTPGGGTHAITTETSQLFHERRRAQARESVEAALIEGGGSIPAGLRKMAGALYGVVIEGKDGRAKVFAYKTLLEAGDWWQKPAEAQPPAGGAALYLSSQAVDQILELARRGLERDNG